MAYGLHCPNFPSHGGPNQLLHEALHEGLHLLNGLSIANMRSSCVSAGSPTWHMLSIRSKCSHILEFSTTSMMSSKLWVPSLSCSSFLCDLSLCPFPRDTFYRKQPETTKEEPPQKKRKAFKKEETDIIWQFSSR